MRCCGWCRVLRGRVKKTKLRLTQNRVYALTIGTRVQEARKKAGMTQEMLARLSGVPQARISALELNKNKKSSYLIQLSQALGVSPNWLETGVVEPEGQVDYTPMEKELLRLIKGLSEEDRSREIAYIQKLVSARSNL